MSTLRRCARLLAAIQRPWAVVAAVLGGLAAAFVPPVPDDDPVKLPGPALAVLTVEAVDGPPWRTVAFEWRSGEPWTTKDFALRGWREEFERYGLRWRRGGGLILPTLPPNQWKGVTPPAPPPPPAPAPVDRVSVGIGLPWLAGLPALWSAVAVWWLIRSRRAADEGEPSERRSGLPWRLARPWVWTFAPIGLVLLVAGGTAVSLSPLLPARIAEFDAEFRRSAPDGSPGRTLVALSRVYRPLSEGSTPDLTAANWQREYPRFGFGAQRRAKVWHGFPFGPFLLTIRQVSLSVWWLIAVPAAFNLATLVRLARRRAPAGNELR